MFYIDRYEAHRVMKTLYRFTNSVFQVNEGIFFRNYPIGIKMFSGKVSDQESTII